jgi:hypothetical protein
MGFSTTATISRTARIVVILLIWTGGWLLSVGFFYHQWGRLPDGANEWFGPLVTAVFVWPASFVVVLHDLFRWLPGSVALILALAFWPCYISLLVLALKTGKPRYFVIMGALTASASIYWHHISLVAMSA